MPKIDTGIFTCNVPSKCIRYDQDEMMHLVDEYGTLTFSWITMPANYDFNMKDELIEFIRHIKNAPSVKTLKFYQKSDNIITTEFTSKDLNFQKVWVLYKNNIALFSWCTSKDVNTHIHAKNAEKIVDSIVIKNKF